MGNVQFICGDSFQILPSLPAGSVDCTVTSPLYNLGIDYRSGVDDKADRAQYLVWTERWLREVYRVLSDNGSLFLNIGGKPTDPWVPFQVALVAGTVFKLQNVIHWIKSVSEDDGPVEGHVKPFTTPRFLNDACELVLHLTKTGDVPLDRLAIGVPYDPRYVESNRKRGYVKKNVRCRGNAWIVPYDNITRREDRPHPATFPPKLAEMCYKLHGVSRTRLTLDPFSGIGSSGRGADALGLDHVGIELSAEDVEESYRMLAEARTRRGT